MKWPGFKLIQQNFLIFNQNNNKIKDFLFTVKIDLLYFLMYRVELLKSCFSPKMFNKKKTN